MRILEINSCNVGSTGNIMIGIGNVAIKKGHQVLFSCPDSRGNHKREIENQIFIGNKVLRGLQVKLAEITGFNGCFSYFATKHFLRRIDKFKPDIIQLHNLHNCYINLPLLFRYIKKHNVHVVWTLHDCWAFTGQCPYFTIAKCEKWKTGCHHCQQCRLYPQSYVDRTRTMWRLKKKWFTGVQNMRLVSPSQWLADLVKESFLKEYSVNVIYNGIDLEVFKPTASDFRKKHNLEDKYIVLGVAFSWGKRKGLDVFIELEKKTSK